MGNLSLQLRENQNEEKKGIFVGREQTLAHLLHLLDQFCVSGKGKMLFVIGEAGIGKTTLLNNFIDTHVKTIRIPGKKPWILRATCSEIALAGNPFAPIAELLENISEEELRKTVLAWAKELTPKLLEGLIPYVGPVLGKILEKKLGKSEYQAFTDSSSSVSQGYYLVQLFLRISQQNPLVLFIDDMHWADESSINLIFNLSRRAVNYPLFILGTFRPQDIVAGPGQPSHPLVKMLDEMRRYSLSDEVSLERFSKDEIRLLLERFFEGHTFGEKFVNILLRDTNGIPFFIDQVLKYLHSEQLIFKDTSGIWSIKQLDKLPIPSSVDAVIKARMRSASNDERRLLFYASVLGHKFHSQVLRLIVDKSHLDVLEILRNIESKYALVVRRESVGLLSNLYNWEFSHAFVQEALYRELSLDERVELHSRTVDALIDKNKVSQTDSQLSAELAYHCEGAGRFLEAVKYRLGAALRANRVWDWSEQAFHCALGIKDAELAGEQCNISDDIVALNIGLLDCYRRSFQSEQLEVIGHELIRISQNYQNLLAAFEGQFALSEAAAMRGDMSTASALLRRRWTLVLESNDIYVIFPCVHQMQHEVTVRSATPTVLTELQEFLFQASEIAKLHDFKPLHAMSLKGMGVVCYSQNQMDEAKRFFESAIDAASQITLDEMRFLNSYLFLNQYFSQIQSQVLSDCIEFIGRIHRENGQWDEAVQAFQRVYTLKEDAGNPPGMSGLLNVIAETQLLSGELDDAELSFQKSWHMVQEIDSNDLRSMILSTGISIAIEKKDRTEVQFRLEKLSEMVEHDDIQWISHKVKITNGVLAMWMENHNLARDYFEQGLRKAQDSQDANLTFDYLKHLAELNLVKQQPNDALRYALKAESIVRDHRLWGSGDLFLLLSKIYHKLGQIGEATQFHEEALQFFQQKNLTHRIVSAKEWRVQLHP